VWGLVSQNGLLAIAGAVMVKSSFLPFWMWSQQNFVTEFGFLLLGCALSKLCKFKSHG